MKGLELKKLLLEKSKSLHLKQQAIESLEEILNKHSDSEDEDIFYGYQKSEIKYDLNAIQYNVEKKHQGAIIRTRIGLYVEDLDQIWIDRLEPIGYYELETSFDGEILDDYFVIEKQKYIKDIDVIGHFQNMNKYLPLQYLKRNHIQYPYVSYISLAGTLFISKKFDNAGVFIDRAYEALKEIGDEKVDAKFLKHSKSFLKMLSKYLIERNLVSVEIAERIK